MMALSAAHVDLCIHQSIQPLSREPSPHVDSQCRHYCRLGCALVACAGPSHPADRVPYPAGGPLDVVTRAAANIRAGKLRAMAVTTAQRSSLAPELPTIAEAGRAHGLADFNINTWFGLLAPANLAPQLTLKLNRAFVGALNSDEMKARARRLMTELAPSTH